MSSSSPAQGLGQRERLVLVLVGLVLAAAVFWLRGGLKPQAPLDALARRSPELSVALANGRPTLVEFYADWCEACRAMAPAMDGLERHYRGELDLVLLNVDNPRWQPELERYAVNGIPQLELFNGAGQPVGRSIGARSAEELEALAQALTQGTNLPVLAGVGAVSPLTAAEAQQAAGDATPGTMAGPRSHG